MTVKGRGGTKDSDVGKEYKPYHLYMWEYKYLSVRIYMSNMLFPQFDLNYTLTQGMHIIIKALDTYLCMNVYSIRASSYNTLSDHTAVPKGRVKVSLVENIHSVVNLKT